MALDVLPFAQNGQMSPFWKEGKFYLHTRAIIQSEITIFGNFEGPKVTKNMKKKTQFSQFRAQKKPNIGYVD